MKVNPHIKTRFKTFLIFRPHCASANVECLYYNHTQYKDSLNKRTIFHWSQGQDPGWSDYRGFAVHVVRNSHVIPSYREDCRQYQQRAQCWRSVVNKKAIYLRVSVESKCCIWPKSTGCFSMICLGSAGELSYSYTCIDKQIWALHWPPGYELTVQRSPRAFTCQNSWYYMEAFQPVGSRKLNMAILQLPITRFLVCQNLTEYNCDGQTK